MTTKELILALIAIAAATIIICDMTECTRHYNTEQNAIELAEKIR